MAFKQATRSLNISTPLGEDEVLLTQFRGEEELSRLFQYQINLISMDNNIAAADIVGKNVTLSLEYDDGERRYFNGFVQRFAAGDEDVEGVRSYRAVVVPWLWFLTQTTDCRIFQEMTIVEIIEQIFQDLGFSDFDTSQIQGHHPIREYCVQYRETDFQFVSRLMEEEGVFFFFEHEDGKHTLNLADSAGAYTDCKESTVDYPRDTLETRGITAHINGWEHGYEFRTGAWAHTDYNFKTPKTALMTTEKTLMDFQDVKKYEQYDYPGEYTTKGDGSPLARVRMEEMELEHDIVTAQSGCKSFSPGKRFTVGRHLSASEEGKSYVIKRITHEAREANYETGDPGGGFEYRNQFECFPDAATFRPARVTRKPIVEGPQTAVVVGPAGSEIYTDEFSRVKVQFFWDREGKKDDQSSCWIRVSQAWAGQNWGFVCIPRIGQEVIVGFLEGDPDQPIVTGRVYNADQMPPYELPANMTQSGIKTRSTQGGGPDNFNEIRFEDKIGEEEMYIHAEKDQNIVVENDRTEVIGRDRSLDVGRDKFEKVARNKEITVGASHTESISGGMSINVGGSLTENVAIAYAENVGGAMSLAVGAALQISAGGMMSEVVGFGRSETVGGSKSVDIDGGMTTNVGASVTVSVGENYNGKVKKNISLQVDGEFKSSVKKDYVVQADKIQLIAKDEIELKAGKAQIILKKNGDILLKGKNIQAKGSGNVIIKGSQIKEN